MQSEREDSSCFFRVTSLFAVSEGVEMELFCSLSRDNVARDRPFFKISISHEQYCGLKHLEIASVLSGSGMSFTKLLKFKISS